MAAAPLPPMSAPAPELAPLSEGARILNTFIAPSKTFTDLRRNAAWWAPFLLMAIVSTFLVYSVGQKIGFRKVTENQLQMAPKQAAQLDNLPADQREHQLEQRTTGTKYISYIFPVITLIIWIIIATALFATFKFAANAGEQALQFVVARRRERAWRDAAIERGTRWHTGHARAVPDD